MNKNRLKQKKISWVFLFTLSLLLSGCAPAQKTFLLPAAEKPSLEESGDDKDQFSVKKIYTYDYDTDPLLKRSAFLKDCDRHEVWVFAADSEKEVFSLQALKADYRYGFYDLCTRLENLSEETLFPFLLQASPDGKKVLIYEAEPSLETLFVWLWNIAEGTCTLLYRGEVSGASEIPQQIHDGTDPFENRLCGSFSQDGRFVAYDVLGTLQGDEDAEKKILVFDLQETKDSQTLSSSQSSLQPSSLQLSSDDASAAQPDLSIEHNLAGRNLLHSALLSLDGFQSTGGETTQEGTPAPGVGLANILTEPGAGLANVLTEPGTGLVNVLTECGVGLVNILTERGAKDQAAFQVLLPTAAGAEREQDMWRCEISFFLNENLPAPEYQLEMDEKLLYSHIQYSRRIEAINLETFQTVGNYELSGEPLFFCRLKSGQLLVAQSSRETEYPSSLDICLYQEIPAADGETCAHADEGRLLYKNVRHLTAMEYDASTRRILLETVPDYDNPAHRQCIILEL